MFPNLLQFQTLLLGNIEFTATLLTWVSCKKNRTEEKSTDKIKTKRPENPKATTATNQSKPQQRKNDQRRFLVVKIQLHERVAILNAKRCRRV